MDLISENNRTYDNPCLDVLKLPKVQHIIEEGSELRLTPYGQLNTGSHFEFKIATAHNEFIAPWKTKLRLRIRVLLSKTDNSTVTEADWANVSLINNTLHSLFSQIDVLSGDTPLTSSLQTYAYRAYIQTILETTKPALDTWKHCVMYDDDDLSEAQKDICKFLRMNRIKPKKAPWGFGEWVNLQDNLYVDPLRLDRDLIGGLNLSLRLIQTKEAFLFMKKDSKLEAKIEWDTVELSFKRHRINSSFAIEMMNILDKNYARYPMSRIDVRTNALDKGSTSRNIENLLDGHLPRKILIGFVNNQAYSGHYEKNPLYFSNCNLEYLQCYVNGQPVRQYPYTPNFDTGDYDEEYLGFLEATNNRNEFPTTLITKEKWANGYTLYGFNLTPDDSHGYEKSGYVSMRKDGRLSFSSRFKNQLDATYNVILYCEYDNQISFDNLNNAYIDSM